jgi:ABC-type glycerol-3-phosphate transport system permease component
MATTVQARPAVQHGLLERIWWNRGMVGQRVVLVAFMCIFLLPVVWAISSSFKTRVELYQELPSLIPMHPTIANYAFNFARMPEFFLQFRNSMIVSIGAVILQVACASLAGYSFARLKFPGRDAIFYTMIMLIFIPRAGSLMAQYELMSFLHLRNSLIGLIVAFSAGLATPTFIMRQTFMNIPSVFEDAALIDGCNRWQAFWRIMAPMGAGGMVVVALFEFIRVWGEFLFTLTMIDRREMFTLGIGIVMMYTDSNFVEGEFTTYGTQCAGYLLYALPVILFYILLQRWFVRGLMEGLKL